MDRRSFALGMAGMPFAASGPMGTWLRPTVRRYIRRSSIRDDGEHIGMHATWFANESVAARSVVADVRQLQWMPMGEWYPGNRREVESDLASDDMQALIIVHDVVWGAAAAEDTIVVGGFRRDGFVLSVRGMNISIRTIESIGEVFAERVLPPPLSVVREPAFLRSLFPKAGDLPFDFEEASPGIFT